VITFSFCYIGVPLSTHMLKKDNLMPLVNAVVDRLSRWKSGLMSKVGHTTLVKSTMTTTTVHVAIAVCVSPWILQMINRLCRASQRSTGSARSPGLV
jgi:Na+/glutamate symporter